MGPAQREQHTELGLRGVEMLHLPHRLPAGMAMFSARGSGARSMAESSARRASFTAVVLASSQPSTMSSMFAVRSIS